MGVRWPDPRFTDNGDGTVTDHLTELIWLKNADCFGDDLQLTWGRALRGANDLADGDCGLSDGSVPGDWRLPNLREFLSLIDYSQKAPALPTTHPFSDVPADAWYWTSTYHMRGPWPMRQMVWRVTLSYGETGAGIPAEDYHKAWPVRGGN
jgi:hypothetical protein